MTRDMLSSVLDLARWAPSGDNTQPWRFEIVDEHLIRVHGFDTRDHVLYDYDGHPSHIAHGALLETMRIAASGFGLTTSWSISSGGEHRSPVYDVRFAPDATMVRDPLFDCIEARTVQRRPMKAAPLTGVQRQALIDAAGGDFSVQFFESWRDRGRVARLLWNSAKVRLTCPEAYPVHRDVIEWRARYSKDRIPEQAVGVNPATARLMQWVMQSWGRVQFFNRYLLGTVAPRIELDLLPGVFCAAHMLVRPKRPPTGLADWIQLGIAVQRIWMTATHLGLHLQPQMTPVIFRWYARAGRHFSRDPALFEQALRLSGDFEQIAEATPRDDFGFFARVGVSPQPRSRSLRHDLAALMKG
ncbi:nitroreductase family protein [Rhodoferax sediminis]|uniref:Molybdopterin biosynthesis protein MoeY n=1 Tax=Rhodoferax sediminis TaxID=2509614 RepID=A0A515D846_9BURK|nr:nitroreductase family protein [Rhodoferax sediminis]QDL36579.1 molybdopterin biosynthesis protein MoeY [Rhodoferax sediminis]